jgi:hypothetical protein
MATCYPTTCSQSHCDVHAHWVQIKAPFGQLPPTTTWVFNNARPCHSSCISRGILHEELYKAGNVKIAKLFSDNYWNCCGGTLQPMRLHWKVRLFSKPDIDLTYFPFLCWHHGYIILLWDRYGRPTRWTPPCRSGNLRFWQNCNILWTSEGAVRLGILAWLRLKCILSMPMVVISWTTPSLLALYSTFMLRGDGDIRPCVLYLLIVSSHRR